MKVSPVLPRREAVLPEAERSRVQFLEDWLRANGSRQK